MTIGITLQMQTKADDGDDFADFLSELAQATNDHDPGCLVYEPYRSIDDPTRFALVEIWESQEALDAHNAAPHMSGTRARLGELESIVVHRHGE